MPTFHNDSCSFETEEILADDCKDDEEPIDIFNPMGGIEGLLLVMQILELPLSAVSRQFW